MNIALFTDTYLPDINGVATSTHILKNELIEHGHNVLVVTTQLPSDSDYKDEDYVLRLPGIDLKKLYGYRISNIYSFHGMKELKDFAPELIHIQTEFGVGIFGKIAAELLNIPVCYTYHTMWADYSHYLNPAHIKAVDIAVKKVIEKISKVYGDSCSELIVPSVKTAQILKEYGISNSINVIPTGLKLNRFAIENKNEERVNAIRKQYNLDGKFVISYIGRIAHEKSIELLIDAIKDIVKVRNNVVLLITGGGPQLDELKTLVKHQNLNDYVIFTGPQDSSLVPSFYQSADIFASASLSETQGLTYIEAMACGLPVLGRYDKNLDGVIVDDYNGHFFNSKEELVELILQYASTDLTELKNNAVSHSKQYSSENFYNKIMIAYQKALNHHHYRYKVVSIEIDRNNQYLVGFQFDYHKFIINLSKSVIENYGLSIGQVINREELDALKDHERVYKAYQKAIKLLMYKDYTYAQMRNKLSEKGEFDEIQLDMTMELLVQKSLIDDYEYTKNYFVKSKRLGLGINQVVYKLKSDGISPYIIDEFLVDYSDDMEYEKALKLVEKLFTENNTKPKNAIIQNIKNKLFHKGFSLNIVEKAINEFDFSIPEEHTKKLLKKEYVRVYERYKNRYDKRMLKSKIITFLVQKGYEYDDVISIMSEVWED